jgi:uncharacterized protein YdiU (UPF0061 family)
MPVTKKKITGSQSFDYSGFEKLDGSHQFKKKVKDAYVDYETRKRHGGQIRFFNFGLAKEMGLIQSDHPEKLNKALEQKLLDTFSFLIINEYDLENNKQFPKKDLREGKYMATRYLQLQHDNKKGTTSGDGRSVWNGEVKNNGKIWDISSCGTGATCLSPATSKYGRYFENGDPSISYGCGYSEIDEGYAALFFSEIFKKNGLQTEEVLCLIEFESNFSINVRAHQNLLRPSHFFNHLKQNNLEKLKEVTDYYIERERRKPEWNECPTTKKKYDFLLKRVTETFARTAAQFEDDYIFCWLDWDGDNILMDGGIIDYGSIRQFGLFHYEYRYDDDDRYSTNIIEQKQKSKYIVQTFAQIVDAIKNGEKKRIEEFSKCEAMDEFELIFERQRVQNLLYKLGFDSDEADYLSKNYAGIITKLRKSFNYFERAKSSRGVVKTNDGITWDAIFCMRDLLRELPQIYLAGVEKLPNEDFIEILKSNYAKPKDLEITPYVSKQISNFQRDYQKLVDAVSKKWDMEKNKVLLKMTMRSSVINKADRVTGDSISFVVEKIMGITPKLSPEELYQVVQSFAEHQDLNPKKNYDHEHIAKKQKHLMKDIFEIVKECREGI